MFLQYWQTELISHLLGEFGRFLSKESTKLEQNFAKVWTTDFKSYFRSLLSSIAFVWTTEKFLYKPSDCVFRRSFGLAIFSFNLFLKYSLFYCKIKLCNLLCALLYISLPRFNLLHLNFLNSLPCRAVLSRTSPSNHSCELPF